MIYSCPHCKGKNRLPDRIQPDDQYRCGHCGQTLIGLSEKSSPGGAQSDASPFGRRKPPPGSRLGRLSALRQAGEAWARAARESWPTVRRRPLVPLALAYAFLLLILSLSNAIGPETWWPGSLNLYLPQWIWAIPGVLLLPLTLRYARLWAWIPALSLVWVFGPIMGFCGNLFPLDVFGGTGAGTVHQRVMTYNVKWGIHDGHAIAEDVRAFHPDLLQMQDSAGDLNGELGQVLAGWNVRVSGQYIVASSHPLPDLETRDISFGGSEHHVVRYTLPLGSSSVTVYDVHLLTPRWGLVAARHHEVGGLIGNVDARLQEVDWLAGYLSTERGPVLLTGDLNAPVQSLVCRRLFAAGLRDAFSDSGFGYGYTYGAYTPLGHPYVRIDHILVSRQWRVARCWVGNTRGSEHCPVIADLVLPAPRR